MGSILIIIAAVTFMIAANALYVAAEFATVNARRPRIKQLASEGNRLARLLEPVITDPRRLDHYVAACQLGITASSLVLGFYGQAQIARLLTPLLTSLGGLQQIAAQSISATIVLIGLTVLQVVLGELLPKSVALRYPEQMALTLALPMRWSMAVFRPAIALFNGTGNLILRLLRIPAVAHHAHAHSPEEIKALVAESAKGGLLEADERQLLRNAFRIGQLRAADVLVPRTRLVAAPASTSIDELLKLATSSGHSRLPIYEGTIDRIIGTVHVKDLFRAHTEGLQEARSVVRPALFVPASTPALAVWSQLRQEGRYVAIALDEFGGTAGMVTMGDLIEEVFGELQDEFDDEPALIAFGPNGLIRLNGGVLVSDINERFNLHLPLHEGRTIGGLALARLGRLPQVGDEIDLGTARLRIDAVSNTVASEVSLIPLEPHEANGEQPSA